MLSKQSTSFVISALAGTLLVVAMVTAAPLANQEEFIASEMSMGAPAAVSKRALEKVVFGNQQNKARVMSKKSLSASVSPGELDKGSEVVVHKETPIEKDLAARADAAQKDFEDEDKIADAMEAAMSVVDEKAKEEAQKDANNDAINTAAPTEASADEVPVENTASEEPAGTPSDEEAVSENKVVAENGVKDGDNSEEVAANLPADEDDDILDLLKATSVSEQDGGQVEQTSNGEQEAASAAQSAGNIAEMNGLVVPTSQAIPVMTGSAQNAYMYPYYNPYRYNAPTPSNTWYDLFLRRRRSSAHGKHAAGRRIKRDLLDDIERDPELARYLYGSDSGTDTSNRLTASDDVENDALLSEPYEYVPISDEEEDIFNQLEDYLELELQRRENAQKLSRILGLSSIDDEDDEGEYGNYREPYDDTRELLESNDDALLDSPNPMYSIGMRYPSENRYEDYMTKRNYRRSGDYEYNRPVLPTRKRYFYPFAKEPDTHWGAFIPEKRAGTGNGRSVNLDDDSFRWNSPAKRDYNDAIHRLQRLAMALSDNRGPYLSEFVQDQPLKK